MKKTSSKFQISSSSFLARLFRINSWCLLVIFFSSCSRHQTTEDEKERTLMLHNNVKSIKEFTIPVHVGIDGKEFISKEVTFDRLGLKRKIVTYGADGSIENIVNCEYDKNNNLVLMKCVSTDSASFKETRSYDKNNNRIELYHYLPDGTYKYRNIASYDTKGRMIELDWYWPAGLKEKRFLVYEGENKTEETAYSPEGNLLYKWKYKYDENNNLIESVQSKPSNTVISKFVYVYGNDNIATKKIFYVGESLENSQTYEYDKNGLLSAKCDFNPFEKVYAKYRYQYKSF